MLIYINNSTVINWCSQLQLMEVKTNNRLPLSQHFHQIWGYDKLRYWTCLAQLLCNDPTTTTTHTFTHTQKNVDINECNETYFSTVNIILQKSLLCIEASLSIIHFPFCYSDSVSLFSTDAFYLEGVGGGIYILKHGNGCNFGLKILAV